MSAINPTLPQLIVDYDHNRPGTHLQPDDVEYWLDNGWSGKLLVNPNDLNCQIASQACGNSRLETFTGGGTHGDRYASAMRYYINAHPEGIDPLRPDLGQSATLTVFMWSFGELDINTGEFWSGNGSGSQIKRVILRKLSRFKFYIGTISQDTATGYFVSFLADSPPTCPPPPSACGPSPTANTVSLVE